MTTDQFHESIKNSTGNESNICQIHVIKGGVTVYDDFWRGFETDDAVNVNSVTKGVMALLFGIAMDKGFIRSEEQKVLEFFPDYVPKRGEKTIYDVTIKHLLTMTAPYKRKSEPWTRVCTSEDWTRTTLDFLGGRKGITGEFRYATLGIQILAGIIENASGQKLIDFANENLFKPLGAHEHVIHGVSNKEDQFDFFMNKNPRKHEWYSDPTGSVTAGWGLCASAEDLAKIGAMVLNEGKAGDLQVVSSEYITKMFTPYQELGERFGYMEYGYLWYKPYKDREVYAAIGDSGNIIYVNRDEDVSVGITGTFKPRIFDRVEFIETKVLPAI